MTEPETLAGYDLVVAISQEAVNRQLESLYMTKIKRPAPNGPKHLISHELNFHEILKADGGPSEEGIDGYVCCPKIDFGGAQLIDGNEKHHVARISFKFRKGWASEITPEQASRGKLAHSVYRAWTMPVRGRSDIVHYVIDDFEISWEATISSKEISDVMNDIVEKSAAPENPVAIHEATAKKLAEFKHNDVFRVSTIFCAMTHERFMKSFIMRDPNGRKVDKDTKYTILNAAGEPISEEVAGRTDPLRMFSQFLSSIEQSFIGAQKTPESGNHTENKPGQDSNKDPNEGIPTPSNPFILGYTISQKSAPVHNSGTLPAYFTPASYRCTLSPGNTFSLGTINFNILTRRNPGETPRLITVNGINDKSGIFADNLFSLCQTKAEAGVADGILAFSRDIIVNHWLAKDLILSLQPSADKIGPNITNVLSDRFQGGGNAFPLSLSNSSTEYNCGRQLTSEGVSKWILGRGFVETGHLERMKLSVKTFCSAMYDAKFAKDADLQDANEKRRLVMTLESRIWFKLETNMKKTLGVTGDILRHFANLNVDEDDDSKWEAATELNMWVNFRHRLTLGTSNANPGSITIVETLRDHLNGNEVKTFNREPSESGAEPGLFRTFKRYNFMENYAQYVRSLEALLGTGLGILEPSDYVSKPLSDTVVDSVNNAIKKSINDLGTKIILPAGDVFMFKGLDTNNIGNISTVINYDTAAKSQVNLQQRNDLTSERWLRPEAES